MGKATVTNVVAGSRQVQVEIDIETNRLDAAKIANWIKSAVDGDIMLQDEGGNAVKPEYSDFLILTKLKKNWHTNCNQKNSLAPHE